MWDWRSGTCLRVCTDHAADVYGLSIHPLRPFLLASIAGHQHGFHVLTGDFNTLAPGEMLERRLLPAAAGRHGVA